jgi:hypothetical protein
MLGGNPNLEYLNEFMSKSQWHSCRVAVLDFDIRSNSVVRSVERYFKQPCQTDLRDFLDEFDSHHPHRRLFIIEDLSADIIEEFGCRFSIDPALFAGHIQVSEKSCDAARDRSNVPRLPSLCNPHEQFYLKYWEIFVLDDKTWGEYERKAIREYQKSEKKAIRASQKRARAGDRIKIESNVYRNIWLEPSDYEKDDRGDLNFGLTRCKASFWSRANEDVGGGSWDG